jgi:hypothetical protein
VSDAGNDDGYYGVSTTYLRELVEYLDRELRLARDGSADQPVRAVNVTGHPGAGIHAVGGPGRVGGRPTPHLPRPRPLSGSTDRVHCAVATAPGVPRPTPVLPRPASLRPRPRRPVPQPWAPGPDSWSREQGYCGMALRALGLYPSVPAFGPATSATAARPLRPRLPDPVPESPCHGSRTLGPGPSVPALDPGSRSRSQSPCAWVPAP